jgi:zinc-ribbon domain
LQLSYAVERNSARHDLEPFSRAGGGMVQDALEEIPALGQLGQPQTVVKVKCRSCNALNAENAKFCNQCGQVL